MTLTEVHRKLDLIIQEAGLNDPNWVTLLSEFDEPPLFNRSDDVAFLLDLPESERGPAVVSCAVGVLDRTCETIERSANASRYFVCLTLMDWDLYEQGVQAVPTPSLLVSPNAAVELPNFLVSPPTTREAKLVDKWLLPLGRNDLAVGETVLRQTDEPLRVYIGYDSKKSFRSLGEFLHRRQI